MKIELAAIIAFILLTIPIHAQQKDNSNKKEKIIICNNNENRPLYVIDGKIVEEYSKKLKKLNPKKIKEITVLKTKEAIELYGEKGKNGAILIFTKTKQKKHKDT